MGLLFFIQKAQARRRHEHLPLYERRHTGAASRAVGKHAAPHRRLGPALYRHVPERYYNAMRIRNATPRDRVAIREIHMSSFAESERETVAQLALDLLSEKTDPATISCVAECDGIIVAHIAFSPVKIGGCEKLRGSILAPLGVKPDYQKRRIGSHLVEYGMQALLQNGIDILFVYGDPAYYGRFGFSADIARPYIPPYTLQHPFGWQAVMLSGRSGARTPVAIACVASLRDAQLW
jgi:putative acetyltransferase